MKKIAVALQYPENAPAPFIVSKGVGKQAELILELAKESGVPVVKNEETAKILSLQEIGDCIPIETYEVLAGIFAFIKKVGEHDSN